MIFLLYFIFQCSSLLSKDGSKDEFVDYIKEEYEEIRNDYFATQREKKYLSLSECRKNKLKIDWEKFSPGKIS